MLFAFGPGLCASIAGRFQLINDKIPDQHDHMLASLDIADLSNVVITSRRLIYFCARQFSKAPLTWIAKDKNNTNTSSSKI